MTYRKIKQLTVHKDKVGKWRMWHDDGKPCCILGHLEKRIGKGALALGHIGGDNTWCDLHDIIEENDGKQDWEKLKELFKSILGIKLIVK